MQAPADAVKGLTEQVNEATSSAAQSVQESVQAASDTVTDAVSQAGQGLQSSIESAAASVSSQVGPQPPKQLIFQPIEHLVLYTPNALHCTHLTPCTVILLRREFLSCCSLATSCIAWLQHRALHACCSNFPILPAFRCQAQSLRSCNQSSLANHQSPHGCSARSCT